MASHSKKHSGTVTHHKLPPGVTVDSAGQMQIDLLETPSTSFRFEADHFRLHHDRDSNRLDIIFGSSDPFSEDTDGHFEYAVRVKLPTAYCQKFLVHHVWDVPSFNTPFPFAESISKNLNPEEITWAENYTCKLKPPQQEGKYKTLSADIPALWLQAPNMIVEFFKIPIAMPLHGTLKFRPNDEATALISIVMNLRLSYAFLLAVKNALGFSIMPEKKHE